jgi:hypothetical protein
VPSFWLEDRLLAAPPLGFWAASHGGRDLAAAFVGLHRKTAGLEGSAGR